MAFCANCGGKLEEGIKFCAGCGKAINGVFNESITPVAQQQPTVLQPQKITADEKYCFSCGSIIKKIAEICPKCGVNQNARSSTTAKEQPLNGLAIISINLILIGMMLYIALSFFGLSSPSNDFGQIIGPISWWNIYQFTVGGGIILAFISLYKMKNKITMIAGIIGSAFFPFLNWFISFLNWW